MFVLLGKRMEKHPFFRWKTEFSQSIYYLSSKSYTVKLNKIAMLMHLMSLESLRMKIILPFSSGVQFLQTYYLAWRDYSFTRFSTVLSPSYMPWTTLMMLSSNKLWNFNTRKQFKNSNNSLKVEALPEVHLSQSPKPSPFERNHGHIF